MPMMGDEYFILLGESPQLVHIQSFWREFRQRDPGLIPLIESLDHWRDLGALFEGHKVVWSCRRYFMAGFHGLCAKARSRPWFLVITVVF